MLVVEQSGKKAEAGSSGKEIAAGTNHQAVAAADKQDGTDKQYCKIHRTKGHDLQSCKKVEQLVQQQKAEYEPVTEVAPRKPKLVAPVRRLT